MRPQSLPPSPDERRRQPLKLPRSAPSRDAAIPMKEDFQQ